jgi:hypothetical protein
VWREHQRDGLPDAWGTSTESGFCRGIAQFAPFGIEDAKAPEPQTLQEAFQRGIQYAKAITSSPVIQNILNLDPHNSRFS